MKINDTLTLILKKVVLIFFEKRKFNFFFQGILMPKICLISENLVRHVFPKGIKIRFFFRFLRFVLEEHRTKAYLKSSLLVPGIKVQFWF